MALDGDQLESTGQKGLRDPGQPAGWCRAAGQTDQLQGHFGNAAGVAAWSPVETVKIKRIINGAQSASSLLPWEKLLGPELLL